MFCDLRIAILFSSLGTSEGRRGSGLKNRTGVSLVAILVAIPLQGHKKTDNHKQAHSQQKDNVQSPINLRNMLLDCGRYVEITHGKHASLCISSIPRWLWLWLTMNTFSPTRFWWKRNHCWSQEEIRYSRCVHRQRGKRKERLYGLQWELWMQKFKQEKRKLANLIKRRKLQSQKSCLQMS